MFSDTKNFCINKKNNGLLKFCVGALALLFCFAGLNVFSSGVRNVFLGASSPVQKTLWAAGESVSGVFGPFFQAGAFAKENQNLKSENEKLITQIAYLQYSINTDKELQAVAQATSLDNFKLQMAPVTGFGAPDVLTIGKGASDGIALGMPVIDSQKALAGVISKVYKNYSEITLISNKSSVVNVETISQVEGVAKGAGNAGVYLDLVLVDDTLNQGDVLITSALDGTFPKGLLLGKITNIEKNDQNPHQKAQVQPFFKSSVDHLFVITNYKR